MIALLNIAWFIWLLISIYVVFDLVGSHLMCRMFPEGNTWWSLPARWLSLANFAACVLLNPWVRDDS